MVNFFWISVRPVSYTHLAIGKDLSSEAAYLQYMAYANSTEVLDYLTGPDANVSMIARLAYSYEKGRWIKGMH